MRYILKLSFLALIICCLLGIWTVSCSESDCGMLSRPMIKFRFFSYEQPKTEISITDTLTVLTRYSANGGDSILINKETNVKTFMVPYGYTQKETTYVFRYSSPAYVVTDTLWVEHTNREHFISMDCGISVFSNIDNIRFTKHVIDSLAIVNPLLDNDEKDNVHIFYSTATDE